MKVWAQKGWEGDISKPPHDDELPPPPGHDNDRDEPDVMPDVMQQEQQRRYEPLDGREADHHDAARPENTAAPVEMEVPVRAQRWSRVSVLPSPGRGISISGLGLGIPPFQDAAVRAGSHSPPMTNRQHVSHGLFSQKLGAADALHITIPGHHCEEAVEQQWTQRTGDDPLPKRLQTFQRHLRDEYRPNMLRKLWNCDGASKIPLLVRGAPASIPASYGTSDLLRQYKAALMRLVDLNLKHRLCQCELANCCALADRETPFERDVEVYMYRGRRISREAHEVRVRLVGLDRELEKRGYASSGDGIGLVGALALIPED